MKQVYEGGSGETYAPVRAPMEPSAPRRLGYQPSLDGVRGLAVALVVVFHLDAGVLTGGFLGVSVFFTLSGFLITTLLVERFRDTGDLGLGGFYIRRIKRLVPASATVLLAIAVITAMRGFPATDRASGDLVAASLNVFNWREVASGRAYADLFSGHSPVAHFWSLAIEEQFYVVWPLVLLVLLRSRRIGPARLLSIVSALFIASAIGAQFGSSNIAYFASWTRAAEILAGAWLAVWLIRAERVPSWWRHLPGPAIGLIVLLSIVTPAATGWAYSGGLAFFALVSAALIAGLQVPSRTRSALSIGPLVGLGRISYGVYLVHWPVFVYVDEVRIGVDGWNLALTRLALTAAISLTMYVVLERPIRMSSRPASPALAIAMALAASLVVITVTRFSIDTPRIAEAAPVVLAAPTPTDTSVPVTSSVAPATSTTTVASDVEPTEARPRAGTAFIGSPDPDPVPVPVPETSEPVAAPVAPTTIAVFGDSVPAWLLRDSAFMFARRDVVLVNGAAESCDGMIDLPRGRERRGGELIVPDTCFPWTTTYPQAIASYAPAPTIGLLVLGQAATVDRFVDGDWRHPCDSIAWYIDDVRERIGFLRSEGVEPVIALPARFGKRASFILPDDYNDRIACVRTSMIALSWEADVATVDLDRLLCVGDDCEGRRVRDGIHVDPEYAAEVLDELVDLTLELSPDP